MRRSSFPRVFVVAIAVALATPCVGAGASKTGWWIRVDQAKTEGSISFQIGTETRDRHVWLTWRDGDETEIDLPEDDLQVEKLYIQAIANPNDRESWFCVFYRENGVRHFDFDEDEDARMKQTDRDRRCK